MIVFSMQTATSTPIQNQDTQTDVVIFYVWTEIHVVSENYDDDYSKANWTLIIRCAKTMRNKREMNQPEHDAPRK